MNVDFDRLIERRNTRSSKWDNMSKLTGVNASDGIPMWVAEMDFAAPECVRLALLEEINRGTYGYYAGYDGWREAMRDWLRDRHGWQTEADWITPTAGVCSGLCLAMQAFTDVGDAVVVFSPVYHAFYTYINANERQAFSHQMDIVDGRYRMDLERLEKELPANARMVFFCSPHNPGGTVWSADEIRKLASFCEKHDLVLVADEIHHDLVFTGFHHHITYTVVPEISHRLITLCGATKAFNLAGAHVGGAVISNPNMRKAFQAAAKRSSLTSQGVLGMIATEAAQRHGGEWLDQLVVYLQGNRDLFEDGIAKAAPGAWAMPLESTYLSWVDFAETGLSRKDYMHRIEKIARVAPSPGTAFGPGGETFLRFNIATPRARIQEAIDRISDAFSDLR